MKQYNTRIHVTGRNPYEKGPSFALSPAHLREPIGVERDDPVRNIDVDGVVVVVVEGRVLHSLLEVRHRGCRRPSLRLSAEPSPVE